MKMVPVPEQAFGNFFEGDCYIILNVSNLVFSERLTIHEHFQTSPVDNNLIELCPVEHKVSYHYGIFKATLFPMIMHSDFSWLIYIYIFIIIIKYYINIKCSAVKSVNRI